MKDFFYQIENLLGQPNLIFKDDQTTIRIVLSGVLMYIFLIFILNISGKRSIANLSMHDYVVTLAMGSIVSSTIVAKDVSMIDGLMGILILLVLQYLVTLISTRSVKVFKVVNPSPKVLFLEGEFLMKNLRTNRIHPNEVYSAIRMQGQTTSDKIFAVILETNGQLSVIKSASDEKRHEITRYR